MPPPKIKRAPESIQGRYAPIPHAVLDSVAFQTASHPARALIFELLRQHSGSNNGHLNLSMAQLAKRGWTSCDVVHRAKVELIEQGLIVETRKGGLSNGPSQYAVTWLDVTSYVRLDIQQGEYRRGGYALKNKVPSPGSGTARTALRNDHGPSAGVGAHEIVPPHGAKTAPFHPSPVPSPGDNVSIANSNGGERTHSLRDLVAEACAFP